MSSCIAVLYIALLSVPGAPHWLAASHGGAFFHSDQSPDPDALYAHREDLGSARRAADIWSERLQKNPRDFEAAWKLARARYWLGGHAADNERKTILQSGIDAGRTAAALEPNRPEGHF